MINKPIKEKAIALPFEIDYYGNVNIAATQTKVWADRVRSVIGTMYGERIMRPKFGTEVPKLLWGNSDTAAEFIEREIGSAFSTYLPQLKLDTVATEFNEIENIITATIIYSLPNQEQITESIGIANISPDRPLTEENL